jgi:hypothetical protein
VCKVVTGIQECDSEVQDDALHVLGIVKVRVKVTLEQALKAQRGSRGIALFFL